MTYHVSSPFLIPVRDQKAIGYGIIKQGDDVLREPLLDVAPHFNLMSVQPIKCFCRYPN